ncbi:acetylglutamate kinase [Streptosporangium canum]|uniref:acetylglutamate kinase n=1 Tax=Streptosporangium canum TaxID=324952 RepID=A0A1I3MZ66_9ACTN|nr:acetylglutamate kinase [Streptosporangium canum]
MRDALAKAQVLVEALPWLKRFHGRIVVIKVADPTLADEGLKRAFTQDVVFLRHAGLKPVVVHGSGPHVGIQLHAMRSSVRCPADVVRTAAAGLAQRDLVQLLNTYGPLAVGVRGEDGHIVLASTGTVGEIEDRLFRTLLNDGRIPVISNCVRGMDGLAHLVDGDTTASLIAAGLQAEALILLTDPAEGTAYDAGWLTPESRIVSPSRPSGGTAITMEACARALRSGVSLARVLDCEVPHTLLQQFHLPTPY